MAGAWNTARHTIQGLYRSDLLELQSNSYAIKDLFELPLSGLQPDSE